jgi:trehalose-6-phosphate synthase
MNLIAKEYVATRTDDTGALVLSEFTGAALELTEAVLVNPHDLDALAQAMATAVRMGRPERAARMHAMRKRLQTHDIANWARKFLGGLEP